MDVRNIKLTCASVYFFNNYSILLYWMSVKWKPKIIRHVQVSNTDSLRRGRMLWSVVCFLWCWSFVQQLLTQVQRTPTSSNSSTSCGLLCRWVTRKSSNGIIERLVTWKCWKNLNLLWNNCNDGQYLSEMLEHTGL